MTLHLNIQFKWNHQALQRLGTQVGDDLWPKLIEQYASSLVAAIFPSSPVAVMVQVQPGHEPVSQLCINEQRIALSSLIPSARPYYSPVQFAAWYCSKVLFEHRQGLLAALMQEATKASLPNAQPIGLPLANLAVNNGYSTSLLANQYGLSRGRPDYFTFEQAVAGPQQIHIRLIAAANLEQVVHAADVGSYTTILALFNKGMFTEYGLLLPQPEVIFSPQLPPYCCQIYLNDLPLPPIYTVEESIFVSRDLHPDASHNFEHPVKPGHPNTAPSFAVWPIDERAGYSGDTWGSWGLLVLELGYYARRYGHMFMNTFATQALLQRLIGTSLIMQKVLEHYGQEYITHTLRHLSAQGIGLKPLARLVEGMMLAGDALQSNPQAIEFFYQPLVLATSEPEPLQALQQPQHMAELLRNHLRYELQWQLAGYGTLFVLLLTQPLEEYLYHQPDYLQLQPSLIAALDATMGTLSASSTLHAILTTDAIRHKVEHLLSANYPYLPIVSYGELPPEANIMPVGRVEVEVMVGG